MAHLSKWSDSARRESARRESARRDSLLLVSGRRLGVALRRMVFGGRVGPARLGFANVLVIAAAQAHVLLVLLLHLLDLVQVQAHAVAMEPVVAAPTPYHEPENTAISGGGCIFSNLENSRRGDINFDPATLLP